MLALGGADSIAVLGGARGTNEDAYVWARFAKGVLGTDNVDAQLGDGLPAEVALGLPPRRSTTSIGPRRSWCSASDLKEELPVLFLRVAARRRRPRGAARRDRAARHRPHAVRDGSLRPVPGEQAAAPPARGRSAGRGETATRRRGRRSSTDATGASSSSSVGGDVAESAAATSAAPRPLPALPDVRFLVRAAARQRPRRARARAHARASCPAGSRSTPAATVRRTRGARCPSEPGLDAAGILARRGRRRIHALVLLGTDPRDDFPDRALAERARPPPAS